MDTTLQLPPEVTLTEGRGGLPMVRIDGSDAVAELYLLGAHLTSWVPRGAQEDVLWLSPTSAFAEGAAIRGGIPVCSPWFSKGEDGTRSPSHGLVRQATWRLVEAQTLGADVRVVLEISDEDLGAQLTQEERELIPRGLHLRYELTLGATVEIVLTTSNTAADQPLRYEEALHTYFRVGDVTASAAAGLEGASYYDKVRDEHATQDETLQMSEFTDRVYDSDAAVAIDDPALQRRILISTESSRSTVVWNPWRDVAEVSDIPDGAWRDFLCVESANVLAHAIDLSPGAQHTMRVRYSLG